MISLTLSSVPASLEWPLSIGDMADDAQSIVKDMQKLIDRIKSNNKLMRRLAVQGATLIQARTQSGLDTKDKKFKRYSSQYAKTRSKSGRQTDPVNLTWTGQMLGSIQGRAKGGVGIISFSRQEEAKKALYNEDNGRSFFDLSEEDQDVLVDAYAQDLAQYLRDKF